MTTRVTIDKAGRVVIPKEIRDELHLEAGDSLQLERSGDAIRLRLVQKAASLQEEQGFWVYRTGRSLRDISILDWIEKGREERDRQIVGSRIFRLSI